MIFPRSSTTTTPYWSTSSRSTRPIVAIALALVMKRDELIERKIGEVVAADDHERIVAEIRLERLHRAGASHQDRLVQVVQLHAELRSVAERLEDRVGEIKHVDRDLVVAERLQVADQVHGVRNAGDRNQRFRNLLRQRVEARREAARKDHRLHEFAEPFLVEKPNPSSATSHTKYGSASWRRQRCGSLTKR